MLRRPLVLLALALLACGKKPPASTYLPRDTMLDPETCRGCHTEHYTDWAGSMHAYASDDPVFRAMNARGQRATNGALGDFCIKCHAPLALHEGATQDGLNLDQVPQKLKGVNCYFCHSVDSVAGAHNDPLHLSDDLVMRGGIADPFANTAHASAHAPLLDRDQSESATMCGACHDIQTGHGADIERTFAEWQGSVFSQAPGGSTCGQCHMPQSAQQKAVSTVQGSPTNRRVHAHTLPGVDLALTSFPDAERQRQLVQELLNTTLQSALCVEDLGGDSKVEVILDNAGAGHAFPSGSAQDRRLWVEVSAERDGGVVYQSGEAPDGGTPALLSDPDLWLMRDCMFDQAGSQVEMFFDAASTEGNELPAQATFDPADPRFYKTHIAKTYPGPGRTLGGVPDRVTARVLLQPMGLEVLNDLVQSGDLASSVVAAMPTLTVGAEQTLEWTPQAVTDRYVDRDTGALVSCVTHTNLNVQADKTPAPSHTRCSP